MRDRGATAPCSIAETFLTAGRTLCPPYPKDGIRGISSEIPGNKIILKVVTDDEATARATLAGKKAKFNEKEALSVVVPDRPGEIAKLTRRLARRMILIENIYFLSRVGGHTEVAFTADNMEKAAEALKAWKG